METTTNETLYVATSVLPGLDGEPDRPCPDLLTDREAVRFLRLDAEGDIDNPLDTLSQYRKRGLLHGVQVGRRIRYLRTELEKFLRLKMAEDWR